MKPRGVNPRLETGTTRTGPSDDLDAGLASLGDATFESGRSKPRRGGDRPESWQEILGVPLHPLQQHERRFAFGVLLRQPLHPFIFPAHRRAYLFPDGSRDPLVVLRSATVLDGIGATSQDIDLLAERFDITTQALRDNRVGTRTFEGILNDVGYLADNPSDITSACVRIGRGIEGYLKLSAEHGDGTLLQRVIDAFYTARASGFRSTPPRS